jgi:ectoine hydroxylase-related dioxygenase (phytanoyl-CoA dioxygenase family)
MTNTVTDYPPLISAYELPDEAVSHFRENGHVFLPAVADAVELAFYRQAINSAADRFGQKNDTPMAQRDAYGKAFLQHMNLWTRDPATRAFVMGQRFARIAAQLMGVDGVRIYHDQALFKEPGGGFTPWHQDQYYWPVDTDHTITMWLPLVDLDESMGILRFASRSHLNGYLGTLPISEKSEEVFNQYILENGMEIAERTSMKAGDATFHCGWNLHSAPGNLSDRVREVMTIIWVADGCRVTEPVNPNQERDITRWLPGLKPGDPVASELNPVAWKA